MKKIYILAAVTLALTACDSNDDSSTASQVVAHVTATISESIHSRASDTSWEAGDKIGITACVGTPVMPYVNVEYTTADGSEEFKGNSLYYYNGVVLNAYYPFTGNEGTAPGDAGVITADTRIGNQKKDTQPKIDFLWDTQTGMTVNKPNVNFTFAHKMSKITFVFKESSKTKVTDIEAYEVIGLKHIGTFDTNTGVCAATGGAASENIRVDIQKGSLTNEKETDPLIFFPQAIDADSVKLRLYLNEIEENTDPDLIQKYTCVLKFDDAQLIAGHHYKFTVNISKAGLNVGTVSIVDWHSEEAKEDIATLDGTPFLE